MKKSVSKPRVFFIDAENTCREVCCLSMLWVQRGKCVVSNISATLTSPTRNYVCQDVIRSAFLIAELRSVCAAKGLFLERMTSDSPLERSKSFKPDCHLWPIAVTQQLKVISSGSVLFL